MDYFYNDGFVCDTAIQNNNIKNHLDVIENCNNKAKYKDLNAQEGNQMDATQIYTRKWVQTLNIFLACVILIVALFYQLQ